jgi:general L-amino acid transport system permease protein
MFKALQGPVQSTARLWRDIRFLQAVAQAVFLVLLVIVARWLLGNLSHALDTRGLDLSFGFLSRIGGFRVADEALRLERDDSYLYAYVVGLANTLQVVGLGLILSSALGVFAGVSLLSSNWLLRTLSQSYVELMRNTPLLVQLFFLYSGVILQLPSLAERITLGPVTLSNRGLFLPRAVPQSGAGVWLIVLALGLVGAGWIYRRQLGRRLREGKETRPVLSSLALLLGLPALAWLVLPGDPFTVEVARLDGLRIVGGARLSPEFAAILLGLVIYTGAFIADIVRAGILAVPHGLREAALASGLSRAQTLRLVVLPVALRIIIPPTTNQFLNLAKNSSLAIGVGYPDLYSVSQTIFNQSGQAVQVIAMMMGTYLGISLSISAAMNFLNDRLRFVEK